MPSASSFFAIALSLVALGWSPVVTASPPALTKVVALEGHGGARLKAPDWKATRADGAVTILERNGADTRGGFTTLILAVEEGPKNSEAIDWEAVRDNILKAAKAGGSDLTLKLGDAWSGADAFQGKQLRGTMRSGDRTVRVEMIALSTAGVLVTITALGAEADARVGPLADAVARTATRAAPAP